MKNEKFDDFTIQRLIRQKESRAKTILDFRITIFIAYRLSLIIRQKKVTRYD